MSEELKLTVDEIREYLKYAKGTFPEDSPKYGKPVRYGKPRKGEPYYNVHAGSIYLAEDYVAESASTPKQLIYAKSEPKYRFVCDDPTPRLPKRGEWVSGNSQGGYGASDKFTCVTNNYGRDSDPKLVFRREEIPQ